MTWPHSPGWFALALLPAALLVGEAGLWVRLQRQSREARAALDQLSREASRLSQLTPALGEQNARAISREKEAAEQALTAWRAAEPGRRVDLTPAPVNTPSLDEYFELLAWIDRTRARASAAQVAVQPGERFGFASLTNDGPPAELAPAIRRQRQRLHYLLEVLLATHPQAILRVQREPPLADATHALPVRPPESSRAAAEFPASPDADYFIPDYRLLIRKSGLVASEAFRLEFSGETPVLRTFLSRLASGEAPVLVRSVSVEPLPVAAPANENAGISVLPGPRPLVVPAPGRFVVMVEWLESPNTPELPAP